MPTGAYLPVVRLDGSFYAVGTFLCVDGNLHILQQQLSEGFTSLEVYFLLSGINHLSVGSNHLDFKSMIAFQVFLVHDIEVHRCASRKPHHLVARCNGHIQRLVIVCQDGGISFGITIDVHNAGMIVVRHGLPAVHHVGIAQVLHSHAFDASALMLE